MTDLQIQVVATLAFGAVCFGVGWMASWYVTRNAWKDDMIERGHAVYHWMNGRWYWKEDEPKTPVIDPAARKLRNEKANSQPR